LPRYPTIPRFQTFARGAGWDLNLIYSVHIQ
jgi:hypothetical protein